MSTTQIARYLSVSQPRLRAYIAGIVFNWTDVDDILQDVAATAIEKAESFDSQRSIDAWMFGIARIKVLKYLEKCRSQKLVFSEDTVQALADDFQSEPDNSGNIEQLQKCLRKLERADQDILMSRHRDDITNRALAMELGYSESKLSRQVSALYQQLMRCIQRSTSLEGS